MTSELKTNSGSWKSYLFEYSMIQYSAVALFTDRARVKFASLKDIDVPEIREIDDPRGSNAVKRVCPLQGVLRPVARPTPPG